MDRYKINAILAYFEKKVQEVEKNTLIKVYEDKFLEKMHNLGNKRSFEFILYLTTNFHLGMKNQMLGIFSQKCMCMYSFLLVSLQHHLLVCLQLHLLVSL